MNTGNYIVPGSQPEPEPERATRDEIDLARDRYGSEDIEIDDNAQVSRGDAGVWVQAWVWLPSDEPKEFVNHYQCGCGVSWTDVWDCTCNDRCPNCGSEIEPWKSEPN